MMRLGLSGAASSLLRALIKRAEVPRDRVLLSDWRSVDWQSLTFVGERHEFTLRLTGPDAWEAAQRISHGLAEAEFELAGHIVADIAAAAGLQRTSDGSVVLNVEALTIAE